MIDTYSTPLRWVGYSVMGLVANGALLVGAGFLAHVGWALA